MFVFHVSSLSFCGVKHSYLFRFRINPKEFTVGEYVRSFRSGVDSQKYFFTTKRHKTRGITFTDLELTSAVI